MPLCGGEKTTQRKLVLLYVMFPLLLALQLLFAREMWLEVGMMAYGSARV